MGDQWGIHPSSGCGENAERTLRCVDWLFKHSHELRIIIATESASATVDTQCLLPVHLFHSMKRTRVQQQSGLHSSLTTLLVEFQLTSCNRENLSSQFQLKILHAARAFENAPLYTLRFSIISF